MQLAADLMEQTRLTAASLVASCAVPGDVLKSLAGAWRSAISRGFCADPTGTLRALLVVLITNNDLPLSLPLTDRNARCVGTGGDHLTPVAGGSEQDLAPDRLFDLYYGAWTRTESFSSYDERTSTLRLKPATDNIAQFCAAEYPGCVLDSSCPSFCSPANQVRFNDSMRNVEICFFRQLEDTQRAFIDSSGARVSTGGATVIPRTAWV